jgi:hypothetical protein
MAVDGIDYLYLETRNWGKSVKFWQRLGWQLVLDLGSSGRLEPPGGGPGVFLEEVSPEAPLAEGVYLRLNDPEAPISPPVDLVGEPIVSHWGTTLYTIRDPDGREFVLQYTPDRSETG